MIIELLHTPAEEDAMVVSLVNICTTAPAILIRLSVGDNHILVCLIGIIE